MRMKSLYFSIRNSILKDPLYLMLPVITVAIRLAIFIAIPHTYEDAFITFRYAENLASGNGFVYNLGEKVLGTTAPLFVMILALLRFLGISCIAGSMTVNLLSEGVTTIVIYKILKENSSGRAALIGPLLYAFSPSNISWAISGMETAFYTAILSLAFYNLLKENYRNSLLFACIAFVVRIDGIGALGIISLAVLLNARKINFRIFIFPLLIVLVWELFSYLYFGSIVPNSIPAKLALYAKQSPGAAQNLKLILAKFIIKGKYLSSICSALFLLGAYVAIRSNRKFIPMILWFFAYYAALILSKVHIHGWYYIPPLFVYITYGGLGIAYICAKLKRKIAERILVPVTVMVLVIASAYPIYSKINQMILEREFETSVRIPLGIFIKNHTPPDSRIYLEPIGIIGYYSQRYIYDDAGLVSPQLIKFCKYGSDVATRYRKIGFARPDYLILRSKYLDDFYRLTPLNEDFKMIHRITYKRRDCDEGFTIFRNFPHKDGDAAVISE